MLDTLKGGGSPDLASEYCLTMIIEILTGWPEIFI